ncbi:MAG: hypothetical protein DMG13_15465 [Acidobacteria bacterium]|nr:MAG: hypothetical protein DMG13_15465 [Acidobacteriota bacterium]
MADQEYRRLTRSRVRHTGFFTVASTRSSLWLGKDHLLNIDSNRYTEEYKRFYFRDIQAITILKTRRREIWNFVLLLLLLIWMGALVDEVLTGASVPDATVSWGTTLVILAVPLLANNILGPACAVYLRTAVQTEVLPSLNRVRRARKVLDRVRPLIAAAQGQLTPEEVSIRMREMIQPSETSAGLDAAPPKLVVTSPLNLSAYPVDDQGGPPQVGVAPR